MPEPALSSGRLFVLLIGDATSLTEAGYVRDDVESLLSRLIQAANGELGAAQQGIVYIDEIDKIHRSGSGFKDLRQGVQHALLKMLEGTVATVPPQGGYKHPMQPGLSFDTSNVLFICGGAFDPCSGNHPDAMSNLSQSYPPQITPWALVVSEYLGTY